MTTLETLLLIVLILAIICDIILIVCWVLFGSGISKEYVKKYICTRIALVEMDWYDNKDYKGETLSEYLVRNFDKYFD